MFIRQYIPALAAALVFAVADMADSLVVGNRMGATGLAAISFAIPVFMVYNVIMHSLGLGGSISFSSLMAQGEEDKARARFQGVFCVLVIAGAVIAVLGNVFIAPILRVLGAAPSNAGVYEATKTYLRILLAAAPFFFIDYAMGYYLRNDDMEKEAGIVASIGNVTDVGLNIILVLFFDMGIMGAALSTLAGVVITSVADLILIAGKRHHLRLFPLEPDFTGILSSYRMGVSSSISYLYTMIFILIGNNVLIRLSGEEGVAVFDIVQNMSYFVVYLFGAVSQASQPVISTYEGECNYIECDRMLNISRMVVFISGGIATVLMAVFAGGICGIFGLSVGQGAVSGAFAIRIFCCGIILSGINLIYANYYISRSIYFPAFLISTLRGAVVLIPAALICGALGAKAFWFCYPVTELVSLAVFIVYKRYMLKERKRISEDRIFRAVIKNDASQIGSVTPKIEAFCEKWEADMKQMYYVQMTVEEMCGAIIQQGFTGRFADMGRIQITVVARDGHEFSLHLRDNASSFNPFDMGKVDAALLDADGEDADFNALGMDIIKKKAKDFFYRRYQGFNNMVVKI